MMARVVIRKPEIPCFVLNSQVRVADWEQVSGTHQGQRQISTPRSKAGHRTVLTNRAINAFCPCKADAIHTGLSRLMRVQRNSQRHTGRDGDRVSAVQHNFQEAAVHCMPNRQNTTRPFAAPGSDDRVAGRAQLVDATHALKPSSLPP